MNHYDLMIYRSTHQALFVKDQSFSFTQLVVATYRIKWRGKNKPTFSTSDTLPTGITLSSGGIVSYDGSIIQSGVTNWTVTATDGVDTVTANMTTTMNAATVEIADGQTFSFALGTTSSKQIEYVADGIPTFAVTSGTLPSGVTMTTSGLFVYDGTGSTDVSTSVEVTATLATSASDTATMGLRLVSIPQDCVFYAPFNTDLSEIADNRTATPTDSGAADVTITTKDGKSCVYVPSNARLLYSPCGDVPLGNTSKSMSIWVNLNFANGGWNGFLGVGENSKYKMFLLASNNSWKVSYGGYFNDVYSTSQLHSGWNHVAVTYDTTAIKLYHDGVLVHTSQQSDKVNTSETNICVGGRPAASDNYCESAWFRDARIYSRALTDVEILSIYQEGL